MQCVYSESEKNASEMVLAAEKVHRRSASGKKSGARFNPFRPWAPDPNVCAVTGRNTLRAEIHYVNVRPQPHIVGQIPSNVIRIVVDDDIIRVPVPLAAIAYVVGSDAEEEPTEPETARTTSCEVPNVTRAKPSREMPVLPGMIEVVVRIIPTRVVPNPLIAIDVRGVRVPRRFAEVPVFLDGVRIASNRSRPSRRSRVLAAMLFAVLWQSGKRKKQKGRNKTYQLVHELPPCKMG